MTPQFLCCSQCPTRTPYHRDPSGRLVCPRPGCGHAIDLNEVELDPGESLHTAGVRVVIVTRGGNR